MGSVEEELWNIFTYYSLHGDPLDPEYIKSSQFVRMCKDCEILGQEGITAPDVQVVYRAEVRRAHQLAVKRVEEQNAMSPLQRAAGPPPAADKMNYNSFLNALMKLSTMVSRARAQHEPGARLRCISWQNLGR